MKVKKDKRIMFKVKKRIYGDGARAFNISKIKNRMEIAIDL